MQLPRLLDTTRVVAGGPLPPSGALLRLRGLLLVEVLEARGLMGGPPRVLEGPTVHPLHGAGPDAGDDDSSSSEEDCADGVTEGSYAVAASDDYDPAAGGESFDARSEFSGVTVSSFYTAGGGSSVTDTAASSLGGGGGAGESQERRLQRRQDFDTAAAAELVATEGPLTFARGAQAASGGGGAAAGDDSARAAPAGPAEAGGGGGAPVDRHGRVQCDPGSRWRCARAEAHRGREG